MPAETRLTAPRPSQAELLAAALRAVKPGKARAWLRRLLVEGSASSKGKKKTGLDGAQLVEAGN